MNRKEAFSCAGLQETVLPTRSCVFSCDQNEFQTLNENFGLFTAAFVANTSAPQ